MPEEQVLKTRSCKLWSQIVTTFVIKWSELQTGVRGLCADRSTYFGAEIWSAQHHVTLERRWDDISKSRTSGPLAVWHIILVSIIDIQMKLLVHGLCIYSVMGKKYLEWGFCWDNPCNRKANSLCIRVKAVRAISYKIPPYIPNTKIADIEREVSDRFEFATLLQFASHCMW